MEGHIIHIDYGFLLGIAPGWWQFETAPFKLTGEYIELIGGFDSECYRYYEALFIKGFLQLRKYHFWVLEDKSGGDFDRSVPPMSFTPRKVLLVRGKLCDVLPRQRNTC